MEIPNGPTLDLCFQPVPEPRTARPRIHLDLRGGTEQAAVVERLLDLGARHLDIEQVDVPWVVLADPEGNGRVLDPDWGDLPWTSLADPSGNELCFLPARPAGS